MVPDWLHVLAIASLLLAVWEYFKYGRLATHEKAHARWSAARSRPASV